MPKQLQSITDLIRALTKRFADAIVEHGDLPTTCEVADHIQDCRSYSDNAEAHGFCERLGLHVLVRRNIKQYYPNPSALRPNQLEMWPVHERKLANQIGCMRSYSPIADRHIALYDVRTDPNLIQDAGYYMQKMGAQTYHKGTLTLQLARQRAKAANIALTEKPNQSLN